MLKMFSKFIFVILGVVSLSKYSIAITGKEISEKVSEWLISEGVNGRPVFSKTSIYKDCINNIEIKKIYKNYKTVKVECLDHNGFKLVIRIKIPTKYKTKDYTTIKNIVKKNRISEKEKVKSEIKTTYKALGLKRSLEKNSIIGLDDIYLIKLSNISKKSFFSDKKDLIGRKLKKNVKMGQILHPRHLYQKFEVMDGDSISIVSKIGNASVTVSGEAKSSGNLGDLIKVKNLRSGKTVKGYIKKNKIIKVFR